MTRAAMLNFPYHHISLCLHITLRSRASKCTVQVEPHFLTMIFAWSYLPRPSHHLQMSRNGIARDSPFTSCGFPPCSVAGILADFLPDAVDRLSLKADEAPDVFVRYAVHTGVLDTGGTFLQGSSCVKFLKPAALESSAERVDLAPQKVLGVPELCAFWESLNTAGVKLRTALQDLTYSPWLDSNTRSDP
eukprot:1045673-Amphidinium_carterae.1